MAAKNARISGEWVTQVVVLAKTFNLNNTDYHTPFINKSEIGWQNHLCPISIIKSLTYASRFDLNLDLCPQASKFSPSVRRSTEAGPLLPAGAMTPPTSQWALNASMSTLSTNEERFLSKRSYQIQVGWRSLIGITRMKCWPFCKKAPAQCSFGLPSQEISSRSFSFKIRR